MRAVKLTDKVWWVGAIDWSLRDFHGYATERGTTYNAYLVLADKITLIDTVKAPFKEEMMSRIRSLIDPSQIEYIVSNHTEMDHSGCLAEVMKEVNPSKVFASVVGVGALGEHFAFDRDIEAVKSGDELNLGNLKLSFIETRMLHWPDSMITYVQGEEVVFSQDAFGMHLASNERFNDELDSALLECEAKKYYANILTPYSQLITGFLKKFEALKLPVKFIAPDHGPVWRTNINDVMQWYAAWAEQKPTNKVVIVCDTMWQSTLALARHIADGAATQEVPVKLMSMASSHRSNVATELIDAGALIVGSPTINNQMFPTVADMLCYVKGLRFKNLIGASFGSYGWSGEAVKLVDAELQAMKVDVVSEPLSVKYVPGAEDLSQATALGVKIASRLKELS
jgi:flavorubredoxin